MREILFRGKTSLGEWVYGDLTTEKEEPNKAYIWYSVEAKPGWKGFVPGESFEEVDPETVCQYTGLTDKNGRKIFEGDIVRDFLCIDDHNEPLYEYGKVVYIHERISFEILDNDNNQITRIAELEVIGNIFDNPELIGDQQ